MIPVILIFMSLHSVLTEAKRSEVLMVSDTRRSKRLNLRGGQLKLSPDNHGAAVKFSNEWTVLPVTILKRRRST